MKELEQKFKKVLILAGQIEKRPRRYGTDELLTSSEIHLIETIGDHNEELSVTDLSKILGITKGAVSQTLKRLEFKELTLKKEDPANNSRTIVLLTSKGKVAYYAHKHWHETQDGGYKKYCNSLEPDKIEFLVEFFTRIEGFYEKILSDG